MKKYYALETEGREASIFIYGDITSWEWLDSDVSSYTLAKDIETLDVDTIHVHINSYGGEVAEGLAIYNNLQQHSATVKTYCDGFACSAASVVFMAGEQRYMYPASLLMIHNAWTYASGNADDLRKTADDLDKISKAAANAYKVGLAISDDELDQLLDAETWIAPDEALGMGFATGVINSPEQAQASMSVRKAICEKVTLGYAPAPEYPTVADIADAVCAKLAALPQSQEKDIAADKEPEPPQQRRFFQFKKEKQDEK